MNISNSIATPPPDVRRASATRAASRPPPASEKMRFEEAVASAQENADAEAVPATRKDAKDREKEKFRQNAGLGLASTQGVVANAQVGAGLNTCVSTPAAASVNVVNASVSAPATAAAPLNAVNASVNAPAAPARLAAGGAVRISQDASPENGAAEPTASVPPDVSDRNVKSPPSPAEETAHLPQGNRPDSPGPANHVTALSQTSGTLPCPIPIRAGDLQTMADAFETSVRHFERAGAHWFGSVHLTLQSSVLKGASFQLVSDGESLSIVLSQIAAAPLSASRRQESQLSQILTRKLGRNVSLRFTPSEIEAAEHVEQSSYE